MAAAAISEKFQMAISLQPVADRHHVLFYGGVFGDGRSNRAIFVSNKSKMAAALSVTLSFVVLRFLS